MAIAYTLGIQIPLVGIDSCPNEGYKLTLLSQIIESTSSKSKAPAYVKYANQGPVKSDSEPAPRS